MSNNLIIRPATLKDVPYLSSLMKQLDYPRSQEDLEAHFKKFTSLPGYGVLVAVISEEIIGLLAWSHSLFFVSNTARFRIEALVIDKNYRKKGVGKKLILFIENIAKNHVPSTIELVTSCTRMKEGTHLFYESMDFNPMEKLYFRKEYNESL